MIAIGLIGAGRIGALHARNIAESRKVELLLVHDADNLRAERVASDCGARVAATAEEVITNSAVHAVAICSPTDTHVDLVSSAAAAGKAVFCEKPLDLDLVRATSCLDILARHPVPFTIGFHRRFDPHHLELRNRVQSGTIGDVEQIRIVSRDPSPPPVDYVRRSGGIFRDMMIHDLDQLRFLLGRRVVGVFAHGSVLVNAAIGEAGDFDTATAVFWTEDGATVTVHNSRRASYGFDQRIEVFGSRGSVSMDNVPATQTVIADAGGFTVPRNPGAFQERYATAYKYEIEAFAATLEAGGSPEPTAFDGVMSLALADAANASARSGQPVNIEYPHLRK